MVSMFGLWSICEGTLHGRATAIEIGALAAPLVRGHHLGRRRRARPRTGGTGRLGPVPAPVDQRVTGPRRGSVLVDADQRVLRQRRNPPRSARISLGRHASSGTARPAAGVLPADAGGL